ncbi:MAG: hypothetical protein ACO1SX_11035 [Actinomycetota bacterium]
MSLLGVHLTLLIGPIVPLPAPILLAEALQSVEVTQSDEKRSGFQLSFAVGRSMPWELLEYTALSSPLLRPFNRVILLMRFGIKPRVLFDGVITNIQLSPKNAPGQSLLTVTGEDVSVMMDLKEEVREHVAQDETIIANKILLNYTAKWGVVPMVKPPGIPDLPLPVEKTPVQGETDLKYLQKMAKRHGYSFYIIPGPVPMANIGYWGPPQRLPSTQPALSVNMGPATNVESVEFAQHALAPTTVSGTGTLFGVALPFHLMVPMLVPPLALRPPLPLQLPNVRETVMTDTKGPKLHQAIGRAQAMVDQSMAQVVTATGEVDALRYGEILTARTVVGVRGAGLSFDGLYYVKSVTHTIKRGSYRQKFALQREGLGSTVPFVMP